MTNKTIHTPRLNTKQKTKRNFNKEIYEDKEKEKETETETKTKTKTKPTFDQQEMTNKTIQRQD
jgi:hypothetical protein